MFVVVFGFCFRLGIYFFFFLSLQADLIFFGGAQEGQLRLGVSSLDSLHF